MFKNLKIAAKLIVGFIIVAALAVATGVVGIYGMNGLNTKDTEIYEMNLRSIEVMGNIREDFQAEQIALNKLVLYSGEANGSLNEVLAELDDLALQATENITQYEATMSDPSLETAYYEAKDIYSKDFQEIKAKVREYAQAGDSANAYKTLAEGEEVITKVEQGLSQSATNNSEWAKAAVDENGNLFRQMSIIQIIVVAAAVVVAIFLGLYLAKMISRPIRACIDRMKLMAEKGDTKSPVQVFESRDESGQLSQMMSGLFTGIYELIADQSRVMVALGEGDFTQTTNCEYVGDFAILKSTMQKIESSMNDTLSRINQSADQVSTGSGQVSNGAQELAQGATEQASTIQELADTLNMTAKGIKANADDAGEVSQKVQQVASEVLESNEKMRSMMEAMQQINDSSAEIGKIIKTIEDIAFQTNILALNAAVEAARAGAAGQGFAVVADEVRNLASKSAEASKNTAALIDTSIAAVSNGSKIAEETAASLMAAVEGTNEIVDRINNISLGTNEQSVAVQQITQGVDQISAVVQNNSATAEESAAASEELSGQAQLMRELVARFKLLDSEGGVVSTTNYGASDTGFTSDDDMDDSKY